MPPSEWTVQQKWMATHANGSVLYFDSWWEAALFLESIGVLPPSPSSPPELEDSLSLELELPADPFDYCRIPDCGCPGDRSHP